MSKNTDIDEVLARFNAVPGDAGMIGAVRGNYTDLAGTLCSLLPQGRCRALALTALEESAMWAVKAVTHEREENDT